MDPFFTIAVTTYDRVDLLRETILSVLAQTFDDFEILVGNDNQGREIQQLFPDVIDKRIRWIDHPQNFGYVQNVNRLLELARGQYFTSLSDDDAYFPHYLETMHRALTEYGLLNVAFSGYSTKKEPLLCTNSKNTHSIQILSAEEWLQGYLSKTMPVIGCYGVFNRHLFQSLGGVHVLGSEPFFSPYNDNLLAVQAGLVEKIAYTSEPLVFYRLHEGSISLTSKSYNAYLSAQKDFLHLAEEVFLKPAQRSNRTIYRELLMRWFIGDYFSVMRRSGHVSMMGIFSFVVFVIANIFSTSNRFRILKTLISNVFRSFTNKST